MIEKLMVLSCSGRTFVSSSTSSAAILRPVAADDSMDGGSPLLPLTARRLPSTPLGNR